eukprot:3490821-Prymnesium_polylepis.1
MPGFFAPAGSAQPTACAAGTVAPEGGRGECLGCDAGKYQDNTGGTQCKPCMMGSYCKAAAAAPLSCPGGSWSSTTNLTSAAQCREAEPGHFSPTGSAFQSRCRADTFNPHAGNSSDLACTSCSRHSTTNGRDVQTQISSCVCKVGYYERNATSKWETGIVDCQLCTDVHETATIEMTNCTAPGATLSTLPLLPGYWRQSSTSMIVRACNVEEFCLGGDKAGDASCLEGHE